VDFVGLLAARIGEISAPGKISSLMRLWTVHPRYLDTKGLVALWREGLLAQRVLRGKTRGYTRHPQLERFQKREAPLRTIGAYLDEVAAEAERRGYKFNRRKIYVASFRGRLTETRGQLLFEWAHLKRKLKTRTPGSYRACCKIDIPKAHPLFRIVSGPIQSWERTPAGAVKINRPTASADHVVKRDSSSRS
jgi:hypothetical protein